MAKVNVTRNYRLFERSGENRPTDLTRHKRLADSMKRYGFLESFPISCHRNGDKHLIVKDGQHRLVLAEQLGLPVYWIEEKVDFDVALVNCTAKVWAIRDYAQKYAANGVKAYQEGIEFAENHSIPIGIAFAMLSGSCNFSNISKVFYDGTFRIKDRIWADRTASVYGPMVALSHRLRTSHFMLACMAVCRVPEFDPARMVHSAERCRDKLVSYSTRDAYLDMLETVYNFGRKTLVPIKLPAITAMRERSAVNGKVKQ